MKKQLIEEADFYYEAGYIVFTEQYHVERGFCCGNGCRHCPYNYINVPEPQRKELSNNRKKKPE